jgi:high-affinity iron transporter
VYESLATATLITFREGLEAALIVGIVVGYLTKIGQGRRVRTAWTGVATAVVASFLIAFGIQAVGAELKEPGEQIFEGTTMFIAVGVLTWMIFWMRSQARFLKGALEKEVLTAATSGQMLALFGVTFVAVFREGVETALILSASAFVADRSGTFVGAVLGLGLAAVLGWFIYASTRRLNMRLFFNVTSVLLLFFAAGLLASGVHEFQEISLLPATIPHVWDLNHILSETSPLGEIMKALFGYNGSPSLLEILSYAAYWVVALAGIRWWVERRAARMSAAKA